MSIKYLAEAYKDYSETEYLLRAREVFETRREAVEYLKNKCQDLQYIKEIKTNGG